MKTPRVRRPLKGATIGERISDAIELAKTDKAKLARKLGTRWQTVQDWTTNKHEPERFLRPLAEALGVTTDELLGVAEGQEPPFAAWGAFLATAEGQDLTPEEKRALRSIWWPPGREPTVAGYQIALAAIRSTISRN